KSKILIGIIKFLGQEADLMDLENLDVWLKEDKNIARFNHYVKLHYLITQSMAEYDSEKAKKSIKKRLKNNQRQNRLNVYKKIAVAASVLLICGAIFYSFHYFGNKAQNPYSPPVVLKSGSNKAVLTLEDGNQVVLEAGKEFETTRLKSNGEALIYGSDKPVVGSSHSGAYNYLTVPRGGQFFVQLSDSTKVWLNSDSKLKYPVKFVKGETRRVELLYGEGYFEVSSSLAHDGAGFQVKSKAQNIDVLGTIFNINAYDGENGITTTLVEGKIRVNANDKSKTLRPNQQSRVSLDGNSIAVSNVDSSNIVSWVNGLFVFEEASLKDMMNILSRWYDAEVFFENEKLKDFQFTGILKRTKGIDDILRIVEASSDGQVKFVIKDKAILIR
ncbi:MAG: FecR family protein, partial [Bacteroidota bacterium]